MKRTIAEICAFALIAATGGGAAGWLLAQAIMMIGGM